MADQEHVELFKMQDGELFAFNAEKKEYVRVNDVRDKAKAITEQNLPSNEARKVFYQQRIKLVEASNMGEEHKKELLQDLQESVTAEESRVAEEEPPDTPPIPAGGFIAFGVIYTEKELMFDQSSVLFYRIVTVPGIGAELNEWLYLTSTNHSPKGTEAYVSYERQDNPTFSVFDWSKKDENRFALCEPYEDLGQYLTIHRADNHNYPTIYVANSTRRVSELGTTWINEVMLFNKVTEAYDLVYSNEYDLPKDEEEDRLHWGPIVETFSPFPNETNRIGFFNATLLLDGKEHPLTQKVTSLEIDDPEFEVVYFQPNFSFIVH